ncbi:MAG: thiamine pyrophosphate-binding protein [Candidatus Paceibacterota bacterium]|jgi:acetolactate synthase-1/2/3 large subunit
MKIKVSDLIVDYIAALGVRHIFLMPGGANMHLVNSIANSSKLKYVCNHHEQACAMAAESYGRTGGNIGVCITTVGPAATNTLTGIMGAWTDSIATLYICGQVKRDNMITGTHLRQLGVQEINIADIARPITKYSEVVLNVADIKYHLQKATFLAKNGRPGPVLLDIPSDIQAMEVDESDLREFSAQEEGLLLVNRNSLSSQVETLVTWIKEAKRPVILAGHGIRLAKAEQEFLALAEKLQIPVLTSMSAHDLIPSDSPLFIGRPGVFGDRSGNFTVQNADLLISIGARHHLWNIGYTYTAFARGAKKVVVDIDIEELKKKTVVPDLSINVDAKAFIKEMDKQISLSADTKEWIECCQKWKGKYPVVLPEYKDEKDYVNSYYFTKVLSGTLEEGEIIMTGVGTSFTGTLQAFKIKKGQRLHSSVGCASMGYDLPSAIGAWFATGKKRIILITGDGSIMLNLQELQTISHYKIPVKIFLLNNNGYLAIKNTQNSFFNGNLAAVDPTSGVSFPPFSKVAETFGLGYIKMENQDEVEEKILQALNYDGPVICDIKMAPTQALLPKVFSEKLADGTMVSKPLEDMYPFLDRQEFLGNMFIKPLEE